MTREVSPKRRRSKSRDRDRDRRRRSRSRDRDRRDDRRDSRRDRHRRRSYSRSRSRSPQRSKKQKLNTGQRKQLTEADLEGKTEAEQEMMRLMGFCGFETTKGQKVEGNDTGSVHVILKRKYRQYMNRKGGFNRPLDFVA